MNDISLLWSTDPGITAAAMLCLGIIFLGLWFFKARGNIYASVLIFAYFFLALGAVLAVLGIWEMPLTDYFNTPAVEI
ncbi:MAG: hypothetical protein LBJ20_08400 [Candidatus Methanoplasma sp.]|nr:hypothetical protein [Candidatus Methanoplasma sp.]